MRLSREQRSRLLAGDYRALVFAEEPECRRGDRYVLNWSRPRGGQPKDATRWITVRKVVRQAGERWRVFYDVVDRRVEVRLVRSVPPPYDAELMVRDMTSPPTEEEIERAAEESAYTGNPVAAVDDAEAPPAGWEDPGVERARKRYLEQKAEVEAERAGSLAERVRRLEEARARGENVNLAALEQRVRAAENRVKRDAA